MPAAIAAATVSPSQNKIRMENGIMGFTVTFLPFSPAVRHAAS